jgi:Zn-dependent peptidase ImmA (M78 family)/predicted transcriptional regulator
MLITARESRGLTQGDLAKMTGISQSAVSKYENGMVEVSADHRRVIASSLEYPEELLTQAEMVCAQGSGCMYHRKRVSVPARILTKIQAMVNLKQGQIQNLLRSAEIPEDRFEQFDITEHESPSQVAELVRYTWRLLPGPIPNLVGTIERAGGIVVLCYFGTRKLDAISRWAPAGPPMFFVNREMSWDRIRWTLAHEIGHLVMHQGANPDQEDEADAFAAEFLMPGREIRPQLSGITLSRAAELKPYWKVSMQALIRRAYSLDVISERQYRLLFTRIGKMGFRTSEPYPLPGEEPDTIRALIDVHRHEHGYSVPEMSRITILYPAEFEREYLPRTIRVVKG